MVKPDSKDTNILQLIEKIPEITEDEIARRLGLDTNEIRNRIRRFSDDRIKIMIVDDERDAILPVRISLEADNYIVIEAYDGNEAVEKARSEIPDIILLDMMMPKMNGDEVCNRQKKDTRTKLIPIIMVTGIDKVSNKIESLERGADDYITKPFDLNELKARIRTVLRRSKN